MNQKLSGAFFRSKGYNYVVDSNGIVHQLGAKPYVYDKNYCATYDTPEYVRGNNALQTIRLAFMIKSLGRIPKSVLDIGGGNGAFMRAAKDVCETVMGYDISGVPVPEGCIASKNEFTNCECVCLWDCLEHYPDQSFVKDLKAEVIFISLPYCGYLEGDGRSVRLDWFENWIHHKPNEHLHYFDEKSLENMMYDYGWRIVGTAVNIEDCVRKRDVKWNILTMAFKR